MSTYSYYSEMCGMNENLLRELISAFVAHISIVCLFGPSILKLEY